MKLIKHKWSVIFLLLWLITYLFIYLFINQNPLFLIFVYIAFTIGMYVGDVKFKKWGLINKMNNRELSKKEASETTSISALSAFAAISIALLTFTVGYVAIQRVDVNVIMLSAIVLILISATCYLFILEARETSLRVIWEEKKKKKFGTFIRWLQIIGWHSLFLYLLLILSLVGNIFFLIALLVYTTILFYYYCLVD